MSLDNSGGPRFPFHITTLGRVSDHEWRRSRVCPCGQHLAGEPDQLFGGDPRSENGDLRNLAARHRHLIAAVEPRTALAILKDLVRQCGPVLDHAKAMMEEEVGHAREEADAANAVVLGFR